MEKSSTLIYLINRFQKKLDSSIKVVDSNDDVFEKAENAEMAPSQRTINNILDFAKSYEVMETQNNGFVEMVLN
jgi:hypothetical protein